MNREALQEIAKQILFNTEEVRAILDVRKTVTRQVVKPQPIWIADPNIPFKTTDANPKGIIKPPYQAGDILYVRETFCEVPYEYEHIPIKDGHISVPKIAYKAGSEVDYTGIWKPSIHMPKSAARIFLKVTDVRVERLQDIDINGVIQEGIKATKGWVWDCVDYLGAFEELWDSTVKKQDLDRYGWDANPWVWVIEFERVEVE